MNPFISFCLYVSARVFVQYLKSRPDDGQTTDSLRFLLSALNALKRRNPLTDSFLAQLDVDMQALALRIPKLREQFPRPESVCLRPLAPTTSPDSLAVCRQLTSPPQPGPQDAASAIRPGAVCDDPEGIQGIMSYRNDTCFTKPDGAERTERREVVDPNGGGGGGGGGMQGLEASDSTGFTSQNWLSTDQSLSGTTPTSGGMYDNKNGSVGGHGVNGENMGSADGQSNRPTPNSSTNSGKDNGSGHLGPGQMGSSGHNSFKASPIPQHQNVMGQGYFGETAAAGFPLQASMGEQQGSFDMTGGWGDIQGQAAAAQVGDGVLRALMNMGPMSAMDLSTWDPGHENMR